MAENNFLAPVWVAPGQNTFWWYSFNDNRGAQYAEANPQTPDAEMVTVSQAVRREINGNFTYFIVVHNDGPQSCLHNLNVGNLT